MSDDKQWEIEIPDASGGKELPLTDLQLKAKSRSLLSSIDGLDIESLQQEIMELAERDRLLPFSGFFRGGGH